MASSSYVHISQHWMNLNIDAVNAGVHKARYEMLFTGGSTLTASLGQILILWLQGGAGHRRTDDSGNVCGFYDLPHPVCRTGCQSAQYGFAVANALPA